MVESTQSYGLSLEQRLRPSGEPFWSAIDIARRLIRVAIPAIVESFDAIKQTVSVRTAVSEEARVAGQVTTIAPFFLKDVPIVLPRGGGYTLTLPVAKGDECLVIFADLCHDSWWQKGGSGNVQAEERRHDLSDGFAILGCWSQPRVLANYSATSAQLRNDTGTAIVDVAANTVTVSAPTINVQATTTATVSAPTVNVTATTTATVSAPTVNVSGSTAVNITGGNCSVDGKNFLLHTHTGVASGAAFSGPVR